MSGPTFSMELNRIYGENLTRSERMADRVSAFVGSWRFVNVQSVLLLIWIALNVTAYVRHWDPYPFILLNLVLSFQAAYTAPIIMISQGRQEARDRARSLHMYAMTMKAVEDIAKIKKALNIEEATECE